jgi:NAD(P)-dependent dehydrogenase (short-subunit alcohol dehydrogenase family)
MQRQDGVPSTPLEGYTVLVTGASSGIGRAIAVTLARAGPGRPIAAGRDERRLREAAAGMPAGVADPVPLDGAAAEAVRASAGLPDRLDPPVRAAGLHQDGRRVPTLRHRGGRC